MQTHPLHLAIAVVPPHALHLAAAATSAVGVVLGAHLLVALSRSSTLKLLADATSTVAAAALRASRVLAAASSSVVALLAASKAASKSYKAARFPKLPSDKRLKAAFAAASLLRLATAAPFIPSTLPSGVVVLAVLKSGLVISCPRTRPRSSRPCWCWQ
jgi:hypothetical protein